MKKIIYLTIVLIALSSCTKDYDVTIIEVDFMGSETYGDYPMETEFLDSELIFGAFFTVDPAYGDFYRRTGDVTIINPVIDEKLELTSNQDFILSNDTLKTGDNLMDCFEYKVLHDDFRLSYMFRSKETFYNKTGYYKFYFTANLSDYTKVSDSCLVKINF